MARQLRVEYPGAIHHVAVRSNGKEELFTDDRDRKYLLSRLEQAVKLYGVRVYLFCLMSKHFHLVVQTPRPNLFRFMQGVMTGYGVYFNRRHRRHGHVTQGRYSAKLVAGEEYLLKLSRYVHLNPVKIKRMVSKPLEERLACLREYSWSSYPSYIGRKPRKAFVDYEPMLSLMGGRKRERPGKYARFVQSGIAAEDEEFLAELVRSPRSIGNEKFREWVEDCYRELREKREVKEDVSFRRTEGTVSADIILEAVGRVAGLRSSELLQRRRDSRWRAVTAWLLCRCGGLTQREAAKRLGLRSGVAVSCQLKKLRRVLETEEEARKVVERLERKLRVKNQ